mgnify:CR=1 FL=1
MHFRRSLYFGIRRYFCRSQTTLNGVVLADGLAAVGMQVSEGQVLVKVKTIAGPAPAARANIAGKVTAVLVKPGDNISNGQTVVRIAAN